MITALKRDHVCLASRLACEPHGALHGLGACCGEEEGVERRGRHGVKSLEELLRDAIAVTRHLGVHHFASLTPDGLRDCWVTYQQKHSQDHNVRSTRTSKQQSTRTTTYGGNRNAQWPVDNTPIPAVKSNSLAPSLVHT